MAYYEGKVHYKGESLNYRIAHAQSHQEDMHEKYFKLYGWERTGNTKANYWTLWNYPYEEECEPYFDELTEYFPDESITKVVKRHYDFPLAYDTRYFFHLFCQLVLKGQLIKIVSFLEESLSGDLVDRQYVKALLAEMKQYKLFQDGAALIVWSDGSRKQLKDIPKATKPRKLPDAAAFWHSQLMRRLISHTKRRLLSSNKWFPLRTRRLGLPTREDVRARYRSYAGVLHEECEIFSGSASNIARLELVEDWIKLKEQQEREGTLRYVLLPATSHFQDTELGSGNAHSSHKGQEESPTLFAWNPIFKNGYTITDLTKLLVSTNMIEDSESKELTHEGRKPRYWVAVIEALREEKYIEYGNHKLVAEMIKQEYGAKCKESSIRHGRTAKDLHADALYDRAKALARVCEAK